MKPKKAGLPTRYMLVATLLLVVTSVTLSSLLIIRNRMQRQVLSDFSGELAQTVVTFEALQSQGLAALERENALLADLPSLKALMTTGDERTIADDAFQFWKVSDNDLFALATADGTVVAAYTRGTPADAELRRNLASTIPRTDKHFLLSGDRLFGFASRAIYFGSEASGTLLGYVISGYAVNPSLVRMVIPSSAAEITFLTAERVITSTMPPSLFRELDRNAGIFSLGLNQPATVSLNRQAYLVSATDLSKVSSVPLHLVVMKSFREAEQPRREINRLLVFVGLFALLAGTLLMLFISGFITGPLELLTRSVHDFGSDGVRPFPPQRGTLEVRELSAVFAAMSTQIAEKNRALLESERLATIGRMASSVSHDLRHYLAAVYANAEFLASSALSEEERAELFTEIQIAVHGTTELIESLLIFSRASAAVQRAPQLISNLLERAIVLVRAHPDASGVHLRAQHGDPETTMAIVDAKQIERAIYNLLLNACQATRGSAGGTEVTATLVTSENQLSLRIVDCGAGVAEVIRENLFDPFVSVGKQNGTGLGLTLANLVAQEHGGRVELVSSRPGETVFVLSIGRGKTMLKTHEEMRSAEMTK